MKPQTALLISRDFSGTFLNTPVRPWWLRPTISVTAHFIIRPPIRAPCSWQSKRPPHPTKECRAAKPRTAASGPRLGLEQVGCLHADMTPWQLRSHHLSLEKGRRQPLRVNPFTGYVLLDTPILKQIPQFRNPNRGCRMTVKDRGRKERTRVTRIVRGAPCTLSIPKCCEGSPEAVTKVIVARLFSF